MLPSLIEKIEQSREIFYRAHMEHKPARVILLFSGGDDSLTMAALMLHLGFHVDHVIHANTGTGIPDTRAFVFEFTARYFPDQFIFADAGKRYENYVMRKGFIGQGRDAHNISYHILKSDPFSAAISKQIRQRRRHFHTMLITGVRVEESQNRMDNFADRVTSIYPRRPNDMWVNLIHYWTKDECLDFLAQLNIKRNPTSIALNRSGECMCGTMQGPDDRYFASKFCPAWGKWLDDLENKVIKKFPWRWGENISKSHLMERDGQLNMFQPMCVGCKGAAPAEWPLKNQSQF